MSTASLSLTSRKEFLKKIESLKKHGHSSYEVYNDFMLYAYNKLNRYSLFNPSQAFVAHKFVDYSSVYDELITISEDGLEKLDCDFFGEIMGELGTLDKKYSGQCFTPFSVSYMCAKMVLGDLRETVENSGRLTIDEPAAGSGGMILAACRHAEDLGIPRHSIAFRATELSFNVYLALAVQCNLAGVAAVCINGNTLSLEHYNHTCTQGLMISTQGWDLFRDQCLADFSGVPEKEKEIMKK
jgi:type I restriction-modification system DNA methylase subunit